MPELPDVEVFKKYFESTALYQEIKSVGISSGSLLKGVSMGELRKSLEGKRFNSVRRHGKHLFAEVADDLWLGLHFGMTGSLTYFKNEEKRPDYERMVIDFKTGYHLSYVCPRKLGKIRLVEDPDTFIAENGLGPDVLDDETLDLETFEDALKGSRAAVKSALMNQRLMAGIGNVYSDEILFQAGIYPKTKARQLDENETGILYEKVHEVLNTAVKKGAVPKRLPNAYLIPHRDKNGQCPRCGGDLKRIEVSGRKGYYCSHCQPKD